MAAHRFWNLVNSQRLFSAVQHSVKPLQSVSAITSNTTTCTRRCYSTDPAQQQAKVVSVLNDGVKTLTLNDPKKRNALGLDMLGELERAIVADLDETRVIIIEACPPGHVFSAGHDLKELRTQEGREYHEKVFDQCTRVMTLIQDIPVPVIAEVTGLATAAGCQLVASCDIAVAGEGARFATPGVSIGLFCSTPGIALSRVVPKKVALHMLLTGNPITADQAVKHGLVTMVVPESEIKEKTLSIAQQICQTSRPVVALGKRFFYKQITMDRDPAYKEAGKVMVNNLELPDAQEGISAFLEKRKPNWTSKL